MGEESLFDYVPQGRKILRRCAPQDDNRSKEDRQGGRVSVRLTNARRGYFVTTSSVTVNDREVFREFPLASMALPRIFRVVTPTGVAVVTIAA